MMTIKECGRRLGLTRQRIHKLIQQKRIPAKRLGREWMVLRAKIRKVD